MINPTSTVVMGVSDSTLLIQSIYKRPVFSPRQTGRIAYYQEVWKSRERRSEIKGPCSDASNPLLSHERQRLQVKSDWTVRALSAELQSAGINVSHDTVWRFLRSEGKTFKKTLVASEQDRPKVARFRMRWKTHQHRLDPDRLVFIDETWVKTNMTRTCGWCQGYTALAAFCRHSAGILSLNCCSTFAARPI
jgi:hypothetical protein